MSVNTLMHAIVNTKCVSTIYKVRQMMHQVVMGCIAASSQDSIRGTTNKRARGRAAAQLVLTVTTRDANHARNSKS